jgi:hypothetical protein
VGQLTKLPHICEVKVVPAIFVITNVEGKEKRYKHINKANNIQW